MVTEIGRVIEGCPRYVIRATRAVVGGEEIEGAIGREYFPPVNGTRSLLGGTCEGVELLPATPTLAECRKVLDAIDSGGSWTHIKPAGRPAREVYAIPRELAERVRALLTRFEEEEAKCSRPS